MLLGETGTGKGTAAAAIGRSGFIPFDEKKGCFAESFMRGFVSINLSQFPETLIESELFGHKKGAFTGAVEEHEGVFARCSPHGAIFLDEIGEARIPSQIKLLQVLQERTFSPVGSHEKLRFRGRVIAATNKPLERAPRQRPVPRRFLLPSVLGCHYRSAAAPANPKIRANSMIWWRIWSLRGSRVRHRPRAWFGPGARGHRCVGWQELSMARQRPRTRTGGPAHLADQPLRRRSQGSGSGFARRGCSTESTAARSTRTHCSPAYCRLLYERHGTYEEVARRTNLDRRTVKAYVYKHRAKTEELPPVS